MSIIKKIIIFLPLYFLRYLFTDWKRFENILMKFGRAAVVVWVSPNPPREIINRFAMRKLHQNGWIRYADIYFCQSVFDLLRNLEFGLRASWVSVRSFIFLVYLANGSQVFFGPSVVRHCSCFLLVLIIKPTLIYQILLAVI